MSIHTRGTNHPAFIGRNRAETVDFYTRVLGMRLVLDQPNLDDPDRSQHLFFEAGPGNFIAFFVPHEGSLPETPHRRRIGGLLHLALNLDSPLEDAMEALEVRREGIADDTSQLQGHAFEPVSDVLPEIIRVHQADPLRSRRLAPTEELDQTPTSRENRVI